MAIEIPERCANCPQMGVLNAASAEIEQKEDVLIQQYMMSDDLCAAGNMEAAMIARGSDGDGVEALNVPQLSRMVLDAEIENVKSQNDTLNETVNKMARACIGPVTLKAEQDGVAYEVTLCRSEESANDYVSPLNENRDGSSYEVVTVKRDPVE